MGTEQTPDGAPQESLEDRLVGKALGMDSEDEPSEQAADQTAEPEETAETAEDQTPAEETTWVDVDGKRIDGVNKAVAELAIEGRQARKEQAEFQARRKAFEAQQQQQQLQQQFWQSVSKENAQIASMNAQIEQYRALDWAQLDTDQMVRAKHAIDTLREQIAGVQSVVNGRQQEFMQKAQMARSEAAQAAYDAISRHVPGFAPHSDIERSIATYAEKSGIATDSFINGTLTHPSLAVLAYKAMQWDQLQAGKGAAKDKVNAAPPMVKPGAVDPNMSQKMRDLNELKQIKYAKGHVQRTKLIQARIERKFFGE